MKEKTLYVPDREAWHAWLAKHHASEKEVWLVYYKQHTGKPRVSYDEAIEEAICFGWIDSTVKTIDGDRYMQKFTPRVNARKWSRLNLERVKKLLREDRMTEAGRAKLPSDLETPTSVPPKRFSMNSPLPELFASALSANPAASENFSKLAPSYRRKYVGWVMTAKKEETRQRRLAEAIRLLEGNEKLGLK